MKKQELKIRLIKRNQIKDTADSILDNLKTVQAKKENIAAKIKKEIERIKRKYEVQAEQNNEEYNLLEKELKALALKERKALFNGLDRIDLVHGAVIIAPITKIRRPRSVTPDLLIELNMDNAVKIAKSVNWDEIAKMTDEQLLLLGTERKTKDEVSWEIA